MASAERRADYDVAAVLGELRANLRGRVSDDPGTLGMYAADASNYRVVPDLVVVPADEADVIAALALTRTAGASVAMRGGGTSMAGNCLGGVVIDVSRHLNAILDIDFERELALVQPGVVLSDLTAACRPHGLTFGADPSSASRATLGGMIGSNACGAHSVAWGTTADNLVAIDVVAGDGERMRFQTPQKADLLAQRHGDSASHHGSSETAMLDALSRVGERHRLLIERRFGTFSRQISGYALQHLVQGPVPDVPRLLCGSEGSLATTLTATVKLVRPPKGVSLLALGFPDAGAAADCVPHVLPFGPLTMESINATLVDRLPTAVRQAAREAGLPEGTVWLLVEVGAASFDKARQQAQTIGHAVRDQISGATASVVTDPRSRAVLWRCRRDGTGLATRRWDGAEAWAGWEDAAVPPRHLGTYLRSLDELLARYGYSGASYGHFGEGCMHMRMDFDLLSDRGVATYRSFVEAATDLVVSLGGSVSGEHGDGRARSEMAKRMYGADACAVFDEVKALWDPHRLLNPGVIVNPAPVDQDLRHHGVAQHRQLPTLFAYSNDAGNFAQAQRRCVGVGKCRQSSGGVMCPSFQVTGEEKHSTRGRARLLWEMLEGDVITDGWRSTEVAEALDLCLSCKGCLGDCPVNVDMATYKAEFTHHYYAGRPWARPRSHFSMGWLPVLARVATRSPKAVNALTGSRLSGALKRTGGIAAERQIPLFAPESFERWFRRRDRTGGGEQGTVLLWPDTFTNYLAPEVGRAAVRVLEAAGFEVHLPRGPVCCGLTWISTGQLNVAKRVLRASLRRIGRELRERVPVIGLEPSCTAALRHDAADLLSGEPLAQAVPAQTHTLAELLARRAPTWTPPKVGGDALVQVHCHQHAALGFDHDTALMATAGITAEVPDSGCCGLAGNFGFEDGHYELSQAVGERVILPKVRSAGADTTVIADGFSCRTQIAQATSRTPRHLAEVLAAALDRPPATGC